MIKPRLQIILLILFRDVITTEVNDTTSSENYREERVNGRIVKLYSGDKPDPVLCFREGFQPDQNDCSIFYRCLKAGSDKYTVFRFQCAPGTIFDIDKEICNYPQNTKRSECSALPSSTDQRHDNDVEDFQHELPKPIIQRDPDNMDSYKPSPQNIYNELSGDYQGSTTEYNIHITRPSSTLISQSNEIVTDKSQFPIKTNEKNNQDENRCTADGFMGDKRNCKKFYRCVNNLRGGFIRYEFLCNDATIWDDSIQGCNHAWVARNSRCGRDNTYNDVNDMSNLEFDNQNYFESNKLPVKEHPQNELNGYSTPNFIQTSSPIDKQTKTTEGSIYYNEPANQIYSSKKPTISEIQTNYGEKIQDNGYSTFNQLTTKGIDKDESNLYNSFNDNYGKNICMKNGFFGNVDDCKKFYRCVETSKGNYIKYEFSCSDGTVWDNNLKACNFASAVKGCGSSASIEDNIVPTTKAYNPSTIHTSSFLTTHNDEDTGYGIQNQNKEEMQVTTTKTQEYNTIECKANGFYHDENNCQYFYRCVETRKGVFTKFAYQCGEGTLWDPNIEACNHAWAVKNCTVTTFNKTSTTTPVVHTPIVTTISLLQTTTQANEIEQDYDTGYNQVPNQFIVSTPKDTNKVMNDPHPIKYNKCSKSGFVGDDNDCKKFYRCVDSGNGKFIQYEFSCGEGTVWDPRIESCNHAWAVEKCGNNVTNSDINEIVLPLKPMPTTDKINYVTEVYFDSSATTHPSTSLKPTKMDIKPTSQNSCKEEGYFGNKADCKKFYRCVDNGKATFEMYEYSCGEGTIWDEDIVACNHPQDVKRPSCSTESIIISTTTSSALSSSSFSTTIKENSVHTVHTSTQQVFSDQPLFTTTTLRTQIENMGQNANKCNEEGYFGDSQDCKNFYRCVNDGKGKYIKYEFTCGEGTIWDQDITACNHPRDVKNPSCSVESNKNPTTISNDASSTSAITTAKATSTSTPSFTTITSNPTTKGDSTWSTGSNVKETSTTERTSEQTLTTSASTATTTSSKSTTENMKPTGQNTCSEEGYFGNVNDCKSFYRCVFNGKNGFIKYDFTCGEGTIWDQDITACNHPRDVKNPSCSVESNMNPTTISNDASSTSAITTAKATSTSTPSFTTITSNPTTKGDSTWSTGSNVKETSTTERTSEQTLTTSASTATTTSSKSTTENMKPTGQNTCSEEGYFGNVNDCKSFYRCVFNGKNGYIKYDFTCGEGTIWDQNIIACNHPQDVESPSCSLSNSVDSTTTEKDVNKKSTTTSTSMSQSTKTTTEDNIGSSENNENQSTTTSTSQSTTTTTESNIGSSENNNNQQPGEPQEKGNFSCTRPGFYPNPNDCKKFYRCVDWNNDGTSFSIFHFECGEGTIWDPSLETCNYEDSVYPPRNCNGSSSQTQNNTESTTSESSTTGSTDETTTTSQQTTVMTTSQVTSTESVMTTQQSTTVQTTPTTTDQQPTTTEKTTTQTGTSSTNQSDLSTTSDTTTTERSTTPMDQTTQTDKITSEESSTSEGTTQPSTTEQQSTSTTDMSTKTTESDKTTTEVTQQTTDGTTTSSTPKDKCPDMDDDQYAYVCPTSFRRHPKYCNIFYQCTEDDDNHDLKIALFNCPNNTIYDETKTQCVDENKATKKCDGTLARSNKIKRYSNDYIEPLVVDANSYACPGVGYFPFERNQECSPALLKCQRSKNNQVKGYVFKCPEGFIFWTISKRCERIARVRDCKRSIYPWSKRHEIPNEIRNVAS